MKYMFLIIILLKLNFFKLIIFLITRIMETENQPNYWLYLGICKILESRDVFPADCFIYRDYQDNVVTILKQDDRTNFFEETWFNGVIDAVNKKYV